VNPKSKIPKELNVISLFRFGVKMVGEVRASHILVGSEQEANNLLSQLRGGKSFEDLARQHSQCPSGRNGGDLGFFGKGQMVPEFESAAFSMEPGQVSAPVKTQFGYHLIKVTGKR
jgi:parvulin-like peptidyl-prolyl isomerase